MVDKKNARIIKYLNLDFESFRKDLADFSKIYFPKTSKDLSEASSGQMMLEQAAFVGDVLSFYLEDRFRNTNLLTANDISAIVSNARSLGYKFQGPAAARGFEEFYLQVPATTGSAGNYTPDMRFAVNFKNVQLQNNNGIVFEALDDVDFSKVNISSSAVSRVSRTNNLGAPTHFILKASAEVMAGKTVSETFTLGEFKAFRRIDLSQRNVLDVVSVVDADGNKWYETDYHAQEAIFEGIKNVGTDAEDVPYALKLRAVPRRFVTIVDPLSGRTSLEFGPGKATEVGTPFVPNPVDIAFDLKGKLTFSPPLIDPQNFLRTRTLGLAPHNTTLTIKYRVGGGKITNTGVHSLREIISKEADFSSSGLDVQNLNDTLSSLAADNILPIENGAEAEGVEEIKQNAAAHFAAQGRLNSREDYIARVLSLPPKFGRIFRVYATTNSKQNGGVQLHLIAQNINGQLSVPSATLKKNVKNYLSLFTRLNQGIDILDGKIVNIGLECSILVSPGYNKSKVKLEVLQKLRDYFSVQNWQINQPIIVDEVRCLIKETEGVFSIAELKFTNKNNIMEGNTYSSEVFNVDAHSKNGLILSNPQSVFEVRYPNGSDLKIGAL